MLRKNSNRSLKSTGVAALSFFSLVGAFALASPANAAPQAETVGLASETSQDVGAAQDGLELEESLEVEDQQSGASEEETVESTETETEGDGEDVLEDSPQVAASRGVGRAATTTVGPAPVTVGKCEIPKGNYSGSGASKSLRLQGKTRYQTAAAVANHVASRPVSAGKETALFVASGQDFADGLTLSALAAYAGWPVVLTPKNAVSQELSDYIAKNKPTHIYIAGGTNAINTAVQKSITAQAKTASGKDPVLTRFAGWNRYETSRMIAECFDSGREAFVTTGANFADAVVAGAPAALKGSPIVLTTKNSLNEQASAALTALAPSKVNIIGGTWSQSQKNATSKAAGGKNVSVISGKNRYATSAQVAATFFKGNKKAVFSTGANFPDALSGVAAAHLNKAPIVLTKATCRPKDIESVAKTATTHIRLGGTAVLKDASTTSTCKPPAPVVSKNAQVAAAAKSRVGKAYVSGAAGPNAFDCSGLTQYAHRQAGINIPRTTWAQWSAGTTVSSPRPGDIVVLGGGGHVGIYMGSGMMVDAGNARVGVAYRSIYATPNAYVRFA